MSTPTLTQRLTYPPNTKVTAVYRLYSSTPLFRGVGLALLALLFLKIVEAVGLQKTWKGLTIPSLKEFCAKTWGYRRVTSPTYCGQDFFDTEKSNYNHPKNAHVMQTCQVSVSTNNISSNLSLKGSKNIRLKHCLRTLNDAELD